MGIYRLSLTLFLLLFTAWGLKAQAPATVDNRHETHGQGHTAAVSVRPDSASAYPVGTRKIGDALKDDWEVVYRHLGNQHGQAEATDKVAQTKRLKEKGKWTSSTTPRPEHFVSDVAKTSKKASPEPQLGNNFEANQYNGLYPADNNIAVSDAGQVVSVTNSSIYISNANNSSSTSESLADFFSVLSLSGTYFDPKVLWDPSQNKFILVVLNGNTPSNSTIVIAFSSTSDPNDSWWFYSMKGSQANNYTWFDYPSIGVTTEELYISGNLFTSGGTWDQSIVYQIDKNDGYIGQNIDWIYYTGVKDYNGYLDFNVTPAPYGYDGTLEPGMDFVSSNTSGGSTVMYYWTTNTRQNNPSLQVRQVSVRSYSVPGDARQSASSDYLDVGDCRVLTAFRSDDRVHFVMNTDVGNGYCGIYYGRITTSNLTSNSTTFGLDQYDYAFPTITPFSTSASDQTAIIGFLRSGSSIYPELRVVTCDLNNDWSPSLQVRSGDSYVNNSSDATERWGDYTGIARRHTSSHREAWVAGCYGDNYSGGSYNVYGTWIGQITEGSLGPEAPEADFVASTRNIKEGQSVSFTDLSSNQPTNWLWTFIGGTPTTSNLQNPTVSYSNAGVFKVSLSASNAGGLGFETKEAYITVREDDGGSTGGVDFSSNKTYVPVGGEVQFIDKSTNNPTQWQWYFAGGTPSFSNAQYPKVQYTFSGQFPVKLIAGNGSVSGEIEKLNYITVGENSITDPTLVQDFELYPNPVASSSFSINFGCEHSEELDFVIVDQLGKVVKHLLHHRAKAGENSLTFSKEMLPQGVYSLLIKKSNGQVLQNERIIIL